MGGIIMSMLDKNHNGSLVDEAIEFGTNFLKNSIIKAQINGG